MRYVYLYHYFTKKPNAMSTATTFRGTNEAKQAAEQVLTAMAGKYVDVHNDGMTIFFEYAPSREAEINQAAEALRQVFPRLAVKVIRRKNGRWTEINIPLHRTAEAGRVLFVTN